MDRNGHEPMNSTNADGKSYGNTTLEGSASAHLGDINKTSQDWNIHGDVHVHYAAPLPLAAVGAAGRIIDLFEIIDRIVVIGTQLDDASIVADTAANKYVECLAELGRALTSLETHQKHDSTSDALKVRKTSDKTLFVDVLTARGVWRHSGTAFYTRSWPS